MSDWLLGNSTTTQHDSPNVMVLLFMLDLDSQVSRAWRFSISAKRQEDENGIIVLVQLPSMQTCAWTSVLRSFLQHVDSVSNRKTTFQLKCGQVLAAQRQEVCCLRLLLNMMNIIISGSGTSSNSRFNMLSDNPVDWFHGDCLLD